MANLRKFSQMVENFADVANFAVVYIEEAHPEERGHFAGNYPISTHTSMESRFTAASTLSSALHKLTVDEGLERVADIPFLVDTMEDEASRQFGAMPERLVIIGSDGRIAYDGFMGPFGYRLEDVEDWLTKWKEEKKTF